MTAKDFKYSKWQGERAITEHFADNEMETILRVAGFEHPERVGDCNIITEKPVKIEEGWGGNGNKYVDIAIGSGGDKYVASLECQLGKLDNDHAHRSLMYAKELNCINIVLCEERVPETFLDFFDRYSEIETVIVIFKIIKRRFQFSCDKPLKGFDVPLIEKQPKMRITDEVLLKSSGNIGNLVELELPITPEEKGTANHPEFLEKRNNPQYHKNGLIIYDINSSSDYLGVSTKDDKFRAYIYLPKVYRDLESSRVSQKHGNGMIDLLTSKNEEECALIAQDAHAYVEKYGWDGFLEKLEECGINRWNYTGSWQI